MSVFYFKHFSISQEKSAMKVGTDAMLLGAFVDVLNKTNGLDVGAGTGVISLMLAQRNPDLTLTAIEIDQHAAEECQLNFKKSDWSARLSTVCADFQQFAHPGNFDLIVSNPPYYETTLENSDERKAQARHTSYLPINVFFDQANRFLSEDGDLWIIVPFQDGMRWEAAAHEYGLFPVQIIAIHGKKEQPAVRSIIQFSRKEKQPNTRSFTVRDTDGTYCEEYRSLTIDYHSKAI